MSSIPSQVSLHPPAPPVSYRPAPRDGACDDPADYVAIGERGREGKSDASLLSRMIGRRGPSAIEEGATVTIVSHASASPLWPPELHAILGPALDGRALTPQAITGDMIMAMREKDLLDDFVEGLRGQKVVWFGRDRDGQVSTGRWGLLDHRENGESDVIEALARRMWCQGNRRAFSALLGEAPDQLLPCLGERGVRELVDDIPDLVKGMACGRTPEGHGRYEVPAQVALGRLFGEYFVNLGREDAAEVEFSRLLRIHRDRPADWQSDPATCGVLAGALISGLWRGVHEQRENRQRLLEGLATSLYVINYASIPGPLGVALNLLEDVVGYFSGHEDVNYRHLSSRVATYWLNHNPSAWSEVDQLQARAWLDICLDSNSSSSGRH